MPLCRVPPWDAQGPGRSGLGCSGAGRVRLIPPEGKQAQGRGLSCSGPWSQIQIWSRSKGWEEPQRGAALPLPGQLRVPKPAGAAGKGNFPSLPRTRHGLGHRAQTPWQPFTGMGLGNATGSGHRDATPNLLGSSAAWSCCQGLSKGVFPHFQRQIRRNCVCRPRGAV